MPRSARTRCWTGSSHSIAYGNPETLLGGKFLEGPWKDVAQAVEVSAYSLKSLAVACPSAPVSRAAPSSGSPSTRRSPGRSYDWMGVAKAALESTNALPARRDLGAEGVRVQPGRRPARCSTLAAKAIPGFEDLESMWTTKSPLGWDNTDQEPTAKAVCALLSDLFPATTGEIVHVDGGFHAMGA